MSNQKEVNRVFEELVSDLTRGIKEPLKSAVSKEIVSIKKTGRSEKL